MYWISGGSLTGRATCQPMSYSRPLPVTPGDVPLLLAQPGQTVPVLHHYLPTYEPGLNPC